MARIIKRWPVRRLQVGGQTRRRVDHLAGEEPLEIRVNGTSFSVTMRTPGADVDLAAGFLVSEGVICRAEQVRQMDYGGVRADGTRDYNVLDVLLGDEVTVPDLHRHVYTTSSCGVCGTASIEMVRKTSAYPVTDDGVQVTLADLAGLPQRLRTEQDVFSRTGGVHAAGLFGAAGHSGAQHGHDGGSGADGGAVPDLLCIREDVGRHNAVDKVVGWALREGRLPLQGCVLQVSGRASFELVQKAAMAGIPVLSAVSAPSALAAELADELGLTLVGFNRDGRLNVYTGAQRVLAS